MTDQYTLEEIEAAWRKGGKNWASMREQLTRPKPEFAIGQVVISGEHGLWQRQPLRLLKIGDGNGISALGTFDYRPLNQQEVGPDWVPKEPVMALRDAMEGQTASRSWDAGDYDGMMEEFNRMTKSASIALAAFDDAIET